MNQRSLSPHEKLRMLSQHLQRREAYDFTALATHAARSGWSTVACWIRHQCDRPGPDLDGSAPLPLTVPPLKGLDVALSQVYRSDHYPHRLEVLHLLEAAYPLPPGSSQPMDGIVLQTVWQADSGRSHHPWWSRLNSSLNLWQLQALQSRGEFSDVELRPPPEVTMPDAVQWKIRAYYDDLRMLGAAGQPSTYAEREAATERLQARLWNFHVAAIHAALADSESALGELPAGEHDFAEAWGKTMVEFLAIVRFPTTAAVINPLNGPCVLPPRLLHAADLALDQPSDLAWSCRISVRAMCALHRHEQCSGGRLQKLCAAIVRLVPGGRFLVMEAIQYLFERGDQAERAIEEIETQFSWFLAWLMATD